MNALLAQFAKDKIAVVLEPEPTTTYHTGSLYVDWLFGAGGLPVGRFTNIAGWESWGKTTLALMMCKAAVGRGGYAAYVDMESGLDPVWASKFGLQIGATGTDRHFWLLQPENAEQALNAILKMLKYKHPIERGRSAFDLIVLDSIAALVTQAELDGEIGDSVVAGVARQLAQFYRMAKTELRNSHTTIVTLNQLRDDFGRSFGYGPKYRQPGGRSIRFYSSIMAEMKQRPVPMIVKETGEIEGLEFKLKVTKNKVGRPGQEGTFVVFLDTGTSDVIMELARLGKEFGIFTKLDGSQISGTAAWYYRSGDRGELVKLGVGEKQVTAFLDENRDLASEVEVSVRIAIANQNNGDEPAGNVPDEDDADPADEEDDHHTAPIDDS